MARRMQIGLLAQCPKSRFGLLRVELESTVVFELHRHREVPFALRDDDLRLSLGTLLDPQHTFEGSMNQIIQDMLLAQAAWLEVESGIKAMEAAVLRADAPAIEEARRRIHDHLDCHLDLKMAAHVNALKQGGAG